MDITLRRRAIYTGMRPYFDDHELYNAVVMWQNDYTEKPKFALSVFVARCCTRPELKDQRAKILASIFNAMELPEAQLLPDPLSEFKTNGKLIPTAEHAQDAKTAVFEVLLTQLLLKFNEADEASIRSFLTGNLAQFQTDERRLMHLREWLAGRVAELGANYDAPILQKLINLMYVAMCEYVGPVKADQYLAAAIKETEVTATKFNFKIHDLL